MVERLIPFLRETLDLWGVAATLVPGETPNVMIIEVPDGTRVWIERLEAERSDDASLTGARRNAAPSTRTRGSHLPFRWAVRWRRAGEAPGAPREVRPRMCGSIAGVLGAMREALEVDRGTPVHVAPAPAAP